MYRLILPFAASLALACGGGQTPASAPTNPCAGANPCGDDPCGGGNPCAPSADTTEGGSFAEWASWSQVSAQPFLSKGHQKQMAMLYVQNANQVDWYTRLPEGESAPVGFRVVKVMYKDAAATSIGAVMAMTKMAAGYDPDNGDWYYGVYDETGTRAMKSGKVEMCINCHSASDDTDYLGGMPK